MHQKKNSYIENIPKSGKQFNNFYFIVVVIHIFIVINN